MQLSVSLIYKIHLTPFSQKNHLNMFLHLAIQLYDSFASSVSAAG